MPREEIFLTTKLDNHDHRRAAVALQRSLDALQTPYLDLCAWLFEFFVTRRLLTMIIVCRADALARANEP